MQISQEKSTVWITYPKPGEIYKHYKGDECEVIAIGKDDAGEIVVIYRSTIFGSYATKPLNKWFEKVLVEIKGKNMKVMTTRFEWIRK